MATYPIGARLVKSTVPAGMIDADYDRDPVSERSRAPREMYNSVYPPRSAGVSQGMPSPGSAKFSASAADGVPPPMIAPTASSLCHCHELGIANGARMSLPASSSRGFLICPTLTRRAFSTAIRFNSRSEEHTSELQSLMRISYAVFCLHK